MGKVLSFPRRTDDTSLLMHLVPSISKHKKGQIARSSQPVCPQSSPSLLLPEKHSLALEQFQCLYGAGIRGGSCCRKEPIQLVEGICCTHVCAWTDWLPGSRCIFSGAQSSDLPPTPGWAETQPLSRQLLGLHVHLAPRAESQRNLIAWVYLFQYIPNTN